MPLPRRPLLFLAAVTLLAGCGPAPDPAPDPAPAAAPALAAAATVDPAQAVIAASQRFATLRAFQAEMTLHGPQAGQVVKTRMSFVAPDRYRVQTPAGEQTIIGDTIFLQAADRIQQMPVPAGLLDQWRSPLPADAQLHDASVEDRGPAHVDGQAARLYRIAGQNGGETLQYWIAADGLPRQIQRDGFNHNHPYRITVTYSRLDDPTLQIPLP